MDDELITSILSSAVALTKRLDELVGLHEDLVRQVAESNASYAKQFADLRAIVAHLGETAKRKPLTARSMADIRRFTGDDENAA